MRRKRPKKFLNGISNHSKLRKKWRSWLPAMSADLSHLLGKREVFWELQEIAKENPKILKEGTFFNWMCNNYIAAATLEVRSFTDQHNDVRSLWRLLYEILEHPKVINRRCHRTLYKGMPKDLHFDMANSTFNNVAGVHREFLTQNSIRKDLRELEDCSERVRKFANKRIAHRTSAGEIRRHPNFNELDKAMDTIDRIFCKYNLLLTAQGMSSTFATRQYDWMETLHEAWVKPGSKFRPTT